MASVFPLKREMRPGAGSEGRRGHGRCREGREGVTF